MWERGKLKTNSTALFTDKSNDTWPPTNNTCFVVKSMVFGFKLSREWNALKLFKWNPRGAIPMERKAASLFLTPLKNAPPLTKGDEFVSAMTIDYNLSQPTC